MQTKIGKILIRSVQFLFWFLITWAGFTMVLSFLVFAFSLLIGIYGDDFLAFAFSPLIWIYGDDRYRLAAIVSFLTACYSFWVLFRPVKTSAQLKAEIEEWNMRELKQERRETAWGLLPDWRKLVLTLLLPFITVKKWYYLQRVPRLITLCRKFR